MTQSTPPKASEEVRSWELPVMDDARAAQDNKTNALNRRSDWKYEPPEPKVEIKPLTAEEVEGIRAAAHADGFAQGKAEGFEAGKVEGIEAGQKEGIQEGFEAGHSEGFAKGEENIKEQLDALMQMLTHLHKPVASIDTELEKELVTLSVSLAKAVIRSEVQSNQDVLLQALSEGLKALPINESNYQIHLHPQDIELLTEHFGQAAIEKQKWEFIEAPQLSRGGCEIITHTNAVDVSIERRVRDVLDKFMLEQGLSHVNSDDS